jgi:hypothetical protein
MIELLGWALEQDSDYADIMTLENDEMDDWGLEPGIDSPRTSDPRTDSPRSTFILEPHLFWVTMNQDQGDSKEISPRNTEPRNN